MCIYVHIYIYKRPHCDAEEEKRCVFIRTRIPSTVTNSQKKIITVGFPPEEWGAQVSHWALQPVASAPERKLPWCLALKASRLVFGRSRGQWETLLLKGSLALSPTQTEQQFKHDWILWEGGLLSNFRALGDVPGVHVSGGESAGRCHIFFSLLLYSWLSTGIPFCHSL